MRNAKFYIFLGALILFQITFLSNIENLGSIPNVFVPMLVWMALNRSTANMYSVAIVGGFFLDMYSVGSFGINIVSLSLFVTMLHFTTSRVFSKNPTFGLSGVFYFIGFLFYELIYFTVVFTSSFIDSTVLVSFDHVFGVSLILQIIYSFVLLLPIIYLSKRILIDFDEKKRSL